MARCPYEKLKSIESVLDLVRKLDGITETKPGIFYLKKQAFLHFHEDKSTEEIWADIKEGKIWGKTVPIPCKITKSFETNFYKEILRCYSL
jgi:hypothetical protein